MRSVFKAALLAAPLALASLAAADPIPAPVSAPAAVLYIPNATDPNPPAAVSPTAGLSFHAGYTTVQMADLNRANAALWGFFDTSSGSENGIHDGLVLGLDYVRPGWSPWAWLPLGFRAEYLRTGASTAHMFNTIGNQPIDFTVQDQGSLSSLLVGGGFKTDAADIPGLSLGLNAWVGYGYAEMDQTVANVSTYAFSQPMASDSYFGLVFEGQLEGSVSYQFAPNARVFGSGGWRWANAASLRDGGGNPLVENLPADGYYGSQANAPVNVDYSGITAQGGISLQF